MVVRPCRLSKACRGTPPVWEEVGQSHQQPPPSKRSRHLKPWWCLPPKHGDGVARTGDGSSSALDRVATTTFEDTDDICRREPLFLNVAGLVCVDWSSMGQRSGAGGAGDRYHSMWCIERLVAAENDLEDLALFECSDKYPMNERLALLSKTHLLLCVVFGPVDVGFPVRRSRCMGVCINRRRLAWMGPTSSKRLQKDFLQKFGMKAKETGAFFMQAGSKEVSEWVERLAKARKKTLPKNYKEVPQDEYLHLLVPPSAMTHKEEYETHREETSQENTPYFCDLDHHLNRGPRPGAMFPTALTHSTVYSFGVPGRLGRLAVTGESLSSQGLDMYPNIAGGRPLSPLAPIFNAMPDRHARGLLGNAMHAPSMAMWMLYVLGNCRRVQDFASLSYEIRDSGDDGVIDIESDSGKGDEMQSEDVTKEADEEPAEEEEDESARDDVVSAGPAV